MSKLLSCPFCAAENTDVGFIQHTEDCYLMRKYFNAPKQKLVEAWNHRPLEDALAAENARLKSEAEKWQRFAQRLIEWLNYEAKVGSLKLSRESEQVRKLTDEYVALKPPDRSPISP